MCACVSLVISPEHQSLLQVQSIALSESMGEDSTDRARNPSALCVRVSVPSLGLHISALAEVLAVPG